MWILNIILLALNGQLVKSLNIYLSNTGNKTQIKFFLSAVALIHTFRGSQWYCSSILSMPAYVIIIVEVYMGDHFVINPDFWKTSEQEEHVMVEIKQIYHLKATKVDSKYVCCISILHPVFWLWY